MKRLPASLLSVQGSMLVEFLIASALLALVIPALYALFISGGEGDVTQYKRTEATRLMREMAETTRIVREQGWDVFANNGTYHPQRSGNSWVLQSGSETIGDFTRSIIMSDVYRDTGGGIVTSGGEPDLATKKVDFVVSWGTPYPGGQLNSTKYFTRYIDTVSFTQTSQSDFSSGIFENTTATTTLGGEVTLDAGASEGTYISPILDAGAESIFSYITFSAYEPQNSTVKAQISVADPVGGNCGNAVYEYIGPDGSDESFFTPSGAIPVDGDSYGYENPGRCFRYKIFFTNTNPTLRPELRNITITYTP